VEVGVGKNAYSRMGVVRIHKSCHSYLATCHTPRAEICLPENTATTTQLAQGQIYCLLEGITKTTLSLHTDDSKVKIYLSFLGINSTQNKFNVNICGLFNCNMKYISKI
jgi:hypothetical protein